MCEKNFLPAPNPCLGDVGVAVTTDGGLLRTWLNLDLTVCLYIAPRLCKAIVQRLAMALSKSAYNFAINCSFLFNNSEAKLVTTTFTAWAALQLLWVVDLVWCFLFGLGDATELAGQTDAARTRVRVQAKCWLCIRKWLIEKRLAHKHTAQKLG